MKRKMVNLLGLIILIQQPIQLVMGASGEIDAISVVSRVIDGDTFDTTSERRIRMADIDAPEYGEYGYYDAEQSLEDMLAGETVYLDIDDIYGTDPYDRLVCVVYVRHNSTHYRNVNKALLVEGVVVIDNYYNEFNPYSWTLYVHEDAIPEFSSLLFLPLFMIATLLATRMLMRRISKV